MAVDVMHLTPNHHTNHTAFSPSLKLSYKSKSTGELNSLGVHGHTAPLAFLSPSESANRLSSSGSSVKSLDLSWNDDEQRAVDRIQSSRKQLEDEVEYLVSELTRIGEEMNCTAECIQIIQDSEESPSKKLMRRGRKMFNTKPREGIHFLEEKGLLNHTPEDVALFLYANQLDKVAIGDYLGEGKEFNINVLYEYVKQHKFHGLDLVNALRAFLASFQLPGEAQKIDRMMEAFARRYCECNPAIFTNTDACYILSFAIIMLNTSLHNPNVKSKPSVEQFISMNRDIDSGKDLPADMLRSFYELIKNEPFHYHKGSNDDLAEVFFNPDYQGWLVKEGGKHKNWKKRWFILTDNCLYYFKQPSDKEPRGIIPLENLEIRELTELRRPHCFEICLNEKLRRGTMIKACKTNADGKVVVGRHLNYRIQASSEDDKQMWIKRIKASISRNPFLEMLQRRRQRVSKKGPITL